MKKMFILVMTAALVLAAGCATQPVVSTEPEDVPEFVTNPPQDTNLIYGVGTASNKSDSLAMQIAEARAMQSISRQLTVLAQGMLNDFERESGAIDERVALEFQSTVVEILSNNTLRGVTPVKREKIKNGAWYVLAKMDKTAAAQDVASIINNEAARYAEFKAMEAQKMMEDQLAKNQLTVPVVGDETK
jgi:hypothetical protein